MEKLYDKTLYDIGSTIEGVGSILAGAMAARPTTPIDEAKLYEQEEAKLPEHARQFCALLASHFPKTEKARAFDRHDLRAYGRQVVALTPEQTREAFDRLREIHTFRPDVTDVVAVVRQLRAELGISQVPGGDAQARRVVSLAEDLRRAKAQEERLLEGTTYGPGWGRQYARDTIHALPLDTEDIDHIQRIRRDRRRRQGPGRRHDSARS